MNFAGVTEAIRCVLVTAKSSANAESNSKTGDGSYRVKKGISWTAEAQKEFEHLKGILSDGSYLWIFDPALRTVLQTDASALSVGAVLFQIDEKVGKKVIGYYSHRNTGPETRYKDYDLELMAVVKAVKSFHCFLYRRKFEVWADHRALEFLKGTKLTVARQYNWLELLSQYSFTISYVRGENAVADLLSRRWSQREEFSPNLIDEEGQLTKVPTFTITAGAITTKSHRQRDALWQVYRDSEVKHLWQAPANKASGLLEELHNMLIGSYAGYPTYEGVKKKRPGPGETEWAIEKDVLLANWGRVRIPPSAKELIRALVKLAHTAPMGGNAGAKATMAILAVSYRWPRMVEDNTWWRFVDAASLPVGLPVVIITDRGLQFAGDFDRASERNEVTRAKTTTYHPQSNGGTERVILSIKTYFRKFTENESSWVEVLPKVEAWFNAMVHSVTGFSPDTEMKGHEVVLVFDNAILKSAKRARNMALDLNEQKVEQGYGLESLAEHPGTLHGQKVNVEKLWPVSRGGDVEDIYSEGAQDGIWAEAVAVDARSQEPLSKLLRSLENPGVMPWSASELRDMSG